MGAVGHYEVEPNCSQIFNLTDPKDYIEFDSTLDIAESRQLWNKLITYLCEASELVLVSEVKTMPTSSQASLGNEQGDKEPQTRAWTTL